MRCKIRSAIFAAAAFIACSVFFGGIGCAAETTEAATKNSSRAVYVVDADGPISVPETIYVGDVVCFVRKQDAVKAEVMITAWYWPARVLFEAPNTPVQDLTVIPHELKVACPATGLVAAYVADKAGFPVLAVSVDQLKPTDRYLDYHVFNQTVLTVVEHTGSQQ
jgi:poly(3-hydroxybutyrate) depolymerase